MNKHYSLADIKQVTRRMMTELNLISADDVIEFGQAKTSGRISLPDGDEIPIKKRVVGFPKPYSSPLKGKGKG